MQFKFYKTVVYFGILMWKVHVLKNKTRGKNPSEVQMSYAHLSYVL